MTVDFDPLVADNLGPGTTNADDFAAVLQDAAGRSDGVPFLLFPVKLETRFTQTQRPVAEQASLAMLAAQLNQASIALGEIATLDLATAVEPLGTPGRGQARGRRKKQESQAFAQVVARLEIARGAIANSDRLARAAMPGSPTELTALSERLDDLKASFDRADGALARIRSTYQRSDALGALGMLGREIDSLLTLVAKQTLPTAIGLGDGGPLAETTLSEELWVRIYPDDIAIDTHDEGLTESERASGATFWTETLAASGDDTLLKGAWRVLCQRHGPRRAAWIARMTAPANEAPSDVPLLRKLTAVDRRMDDIAGASDPARLRSFDHAIADLEATLAKTPGADRAVLDSTDELIARVRHRLLDIAADTDRSGRPAELRKIRRRAVQAMQRVRAWRTTCARELEAQPAKPTADRGSKAMLRALATFDGRVEEVVSWDYRRAPRWTRSLAHALDDVRTELARDPTVSRRVGDRAAAMITLIEPKLLGLASASQRREVSATLLRPVRLASARMLREWHRWRDDGAMVLPDAQPEIGELPTRVGAWSRAASSPILPDRFVVVTVSGRQVSHVVVGKQIPADLKLGLDPDPEANEQFSLDANGDLTVGGSIRWMVDYDEALTKGMAITVPISPAEAAAGFDHVYVLGLCAGDKADGQERVTALLDNHHYGQTGLGLLRVGTATNNSEREAAAYSSDEDPDAAYAIERGESLPAGDPDADGRRLARALGINPTTFAHVEHAGGHDIADAMLVNAALWPATLGHYLEEYFGSLLPVPVLDQLRHHALAHVTGRGLLSGLRIGSQPYGILPTAAFSRFVSRDPQDRFSQVLNLVLRTMNADWTRLRVAHVNSMNDPRTTDPQAQFMRILGLEGVSVAADYRFALNCARQQPSSDAAGFLSFGIPGAEGAGSFGPAALIDRFAEAFRHGLQLPAGPVLENGQIGPTFDKAYKRLRKTRAYEVRYLSGAKPLVGALLGDHAADIPFLLSQSVATLARQTLEDTASTRPLLYLLLRHALLLETREAALRILADARMLTNEARRRSGESDVFQVHTLASDWSVTRWSYLFAPLSQLDGRFDIDFPDQPGTLYDYLRSGTERPMEAYVSPRTGNAVFQGFAGRARHQPFIDRMTDHAAKVQALAAMPAGQLESMMLEHLDTCSHRLDAWITSLAHRRLTEMRGATPDSIYGVYVGAFGWVEDLRPDGERPVKTGLPEVYDDASQPPVHTDPENQGFIHAPSLNHAATAAILRSGYLSEAEKPDIESRMAVNLSSRRVRVASGIIASIQQGNDLGSVLGYRFERALHDNFAADGVTLDDLIEPLRRAYPSRIAVDPTLTDGDASARRVIDGLSLLQTVLDWMRDHSRAQDRDHTMFEVLRDEGRYTGHPFGIVGAGGEGILPAPTDAAGQRRLDGVLMALDRVADALDAVGDLVISESIYQIVQGNHVRAAAVIAALAQGKAIPEAEIIRTPRSGVPLSHRVVVAMEPADARSFSPALVGADELDEARRQALPTAWSALPMTPRAAAEASLNRWLGDRLGPPQHIVAQVRDPTTGEETAVSAAALGLQPLDLLAILGPGFEAGLTELDARVLDAVRPAEIDDTAPPPRLTVSHARGADWDDGARSFAEASALMEAAHDCIAHAQGASRLDFVLAEGPGVPAAIDLAELDRRVTDALAALRGTADRALGLLSDGAVADVTALGAQDVAACADEADARLLTPPDPQGKRHFVDLETFWALREQIHAVLLDAAGFGIPHVLPAAPAADAAPLREAIARDLLEALQSACTGLAERWLTAEAANAARASAADEAKGRTAVLKAIFGEAFAVLPLFTLDPAEEAVTALKVGPSLSDDPSLAGWLHGVTIVRDNAAALARVIAVAEAFGGPVERGTPIQLPFVAGEPWLGAALPEGFVAEGGRLCLALYGADALATDGGACCGFVVDHWDEVIPAREETTGVAFNYDQPDATPPQCLLLVVPPVVRGHWQWSDLIQTLHDTLELAKNRTVELEHLQDDLYGQILPGIVGEIVPEAVRSGSAGIAGSRIVLDFGKNNAPQASGAPGP